MVAITRISIGAAPNDGTGDPIRSAFATVDDNFTALAGALGNAGAATFVDTDGVVRSVADAFAIRPPNSDTLVAATTIPPQSNIVASGSGLCVVANPADTTQVGKLAGFSVSGGAAGATIKFTARGRIVGVPSDYSPGNALYIAANGGLTKTRPSAGWLQQVGVAITSSDVLYAPGLAGLFPSSFSLPTGVVTLASVVGSQTGVTPAGLPVRMDQFLGGLDNVVGVGSATLLAGKIDPSPSNAVHRALAASHVPEGGILATFTASAAGLSLTSTQMANVFANARTLTL